jgi:site-specific recombinase XerD/RNA polymerase subunit RPABC4/transcription elongation factor Spt4
MMERRDIYKREYYLQYWLERVHTDASLSASDREDILKFVDFMQKEERSSLRIMRCIIAILQAKKVIKRPFRECTKEDIQHFINYLEDNGYRPSTLLTYKSIIKKFFKVVYGNNEYYPDAVRWIKLKVSKDKQREEEQLSYDQFLTEDEIKVLIDTANTIQRKALIAVGYETGARPEELLNIRIKDILFDSKGAKVILRGKTVERVTRVIAYVSLLKQWLSIHPFKNDPNAYLWLSEATNHRWRPLGLRSAEKMFKDIMKQAGIQKRPRLYILRHSRATHLANKLTEAQMCSYFGWQLGTKVVQRYIHLAGVRTDDALLELAGVKVDKDNNGSALKVRYCKRCNEMLSPNHEFCTRCGYSDKDAVANTIASDDVIILQGEEKKELERRINRLEAILTRLVSELKKLKEN